MLEYQNKTVQEVAACTCDRCQRRMTRDDPDWHEKLSVAFRGGFDSIFGDGCMVSIDLCQQCVKEALGPWLRVASAGREFGASPTVDEATIDRAARDNPDLPRAFVAETLQGLAEARAGLDADIKEFSDDIRKMRICLGEQGRFYSDRDLAFAWTRCSDRVCASWLGLPDDAIELAKTLRQYLPEPKDSQ